MNNKAIRMARKARMSAPAAVEDFHQFLDLDLPVALGAAMKGVRHAMLEMVVEDLLLDLVEGGTHRPHLVDDVDAVAVFLDHAGNAAHLALDAAQPGELGLLDPVIHA